MVLGGILKINFLLFALIILSACSNQSTRKPSSENLIEILNNIKTDVLSFKGSYDTCSEKANEYYQQLFSLQSDRVILTNYSDVELEELTKASFATRVAIRDHFAQLIPSEAKAKDCISSVSNLNRALRYLEDYIISYYYPENSNHEFINLTGDGLYFLKNSKFNNFSELQSGDIILSRGNAYTSAAIARIGVNDAQFSHLSFVYKDEKQKLWTIEAHIEIGAVVAPIDVHIDQQNSRTVVFRYKDTDLAHKAAKAIFDKVKSHSDRGKNIEYDFGMNYKDDKRLFCSEVIYQGFNYVTNGILDVPKIKTQFNPGLISFLNKMGIDVNKENVDSFYTFSPADIEFDPDFSLVAEWRNPLKLKESRMKDAILTKMFEWMEEDGYEFHPRINISTQSGIFWLIRRIPFVKKLAQEKFPMNMKASQLKLFLVLDKVGDLILEQLEEFQKTKKYNLTPAEMFSFLEKLKDTDYQKFKRKKKSAIFHQWFRPKK